MVILQLQSQSTWGPEVQDLSYLELTFNEMLQNCLVRALMYMIAVILISVHLHNTQYVYIATGCLNLKQCIFQSSDAFVSFNPVRGHQISFTVCHCMLPCTRTKYIKILQLFTGTCNNTSTPIHSMVLFPVWRCRVSIAPDLQFSVLLEESQANLRTH